MGFRLIAAGKTGTTNDKRDAWFIGFTPKTLSLTWIGFDDNTPVGLSGSQGAVPIWTRYMLLETAGQPNVDFPVPPGIAFASVDETSGGLATPLCPSDVVVQEAFKEGTQPGNLCPLHSPLAPPPPPMDQFGAPVALDTTGTVVTDTTATSAPRPPTPVPPAPPPPPRTTEPQPSTNTSAPQTTTTGSSPPTTTSNRPR